MIKVEVPATSANIGPGFDAFGLALSLSNTFSFEEKDDGKLTIRGVERKYQSSSNLVYKAMLKVFNQVDYKPKGLFINNEINIPISRGLGSSASCIVGGIFGANALLGNPLPIETLFDLAVKLEGHPDNVAPAIYGGLVVSLNENGRNFYLKNEVYPSYEFFTLIPDFTLSTLDARRALPPKINLSDGVYNISRATMTYLSLINGNHDILKACMKDRLHQPYRKKLIAHYDVMVKQAKEFGALNACISGAGPTILVINSDDNIDFHEKLKAYMKDKTPDWQLLKLIPDNEGVKISEGSGGYD